MVICCRMRFHRLDLNLLVVLDALLAEKNVSRAASRLNLTQPAISNSLSKLRQHFEDELLVKLGRQMVPTPLAESLRKPVREALVDLQAIAESRPSFDPATVEKVFHIVASDYVAATLLPAAVARLAEIAPGVSIHTLPVSEPTVGLLARGEVDFQIIPEEATLSDHPHELLFEDRYVCIAWSRNRFIQDPLSREQYLSARHVITTFDSERMLAFDEAYVQRQGWHRDAVAQLPSFTLLPFYVIGTGQIATIHERLARLYAKTMPLKVITPEIDFPLLRERIQWHHNRENDPANIWLREFLIDVAAEV